MPDPEAVIDLADLQDHRKAVWWVEKVARTSLELLKPQDRQEQHEEYIEQAEHDDAVQDLVTDLQLERVLCDDEDVSHCFSCAMITSINRSSSGFPAQNAFTDPA